jgi:hypothetical protein
MSLIDDIDDWIVDAETNTPQATRKKKIRLYGEGVKAKLRQAQYSIDCISTLASEFDGTMVTTDPDEASVSARVEFYCDAYWGFLYSTLDILAQVINQKLDLGLSERKVDFNKISEELNKAPHHGGALQKAVDACIASNACSNIKKYRNCSSHRRPICIQEKEVRTRITAGYTTTTTNTLDGVQRQLCDNPLAVTPQFRQTSRKIPGYLETTQNSLHGHLKKIFKKL